MYAGGRRKFSENAPIREPGIEDLPEASRKAVSPPTLSYSSGGPLVAVFIRGDKASLSNSSFSMNASKEEAEEEVEGEDNSPVFEEHHFLIRSQINLCWILRFPSKSTASAWLKETQPPTIVLPSVGKIWMLTEQAEVFWATETSLEKISWNKVVYCAYSILISAHSI